MDTERIANATREAEEHLRKAADAMLAAGVPYHAQLMDRTRDAAACMRRRRERLETFRDRRGERLYSLHELAQTARAHGFHARIRGKGEHARVVVAVPWVDPTTGEEGTSEESCTDARGLARILGY